MLVVVVVVVDWADDVVAAVVAGVGEGIGDWPEDVVVRGEGIGLLVNPGTGTSRLIILEVPDASCWSKASSSSLISSISSSTFTLHDLILDIIKQRYTSARILAALRLWAAFVGWTGAYQRAGRDRVSDSDVGHGNMRSYYQFILYIFI